MGPAVIALLHGFGIWEAQNIPSGWGEDVFGANQPSVDAARLFVHAFVHSFVHPLAGIKTKEFAKFWEAPI